MDDQKLLKAPVKTIRIDRYAVTTAFMVIVILIMELAIKQILRRRIVVKANAIFLKHFVDGAIEDLLDLTDSEESSSTSSDNGVFESHQPFVLELHDLVKDEPPPEVQPAEAKGKKYKKKKKGQPASKNLNSGTSSSASESSVPPTAIVVHSKEEFYDAHESYHGLAESQAAVSPAAVSPAVAAVMQAVPEHGSAPKVAQEELPTSQLGSASQREPPTTITKPSTGPESKTRIWMEKPAHYKNKNKKPAAKPKTPKKRKSEGPTCSMFLAELSRKLASKKKQEAEQPKNVVQTIIDSITNALPIKFSRRTPPKKESPMHIDSLQALAPELLPNDTLDILPPQIHKIDDEPSFIEIDTTKPAFKMPKMPLMSSDIFKQALERPRVVPTEDVAVNTGGDHDVATEIAKYVGTLKKISLIAEEFNQKTAKNLKEIVDSVQEDLIKKLEEIQAERKAALHVEKPVQIYERPESFEEE